MRSKGLHPKRCGFTLAELLVVIAIMGLLFTIALPALNKMTGQSKLEAAANTVHSAAKLARQYAITHKQPTFLVFHDPQSDPALAYQAFAIFSINIHTPPITQTNGYFIQEWQRLPAGVIFDPDVDPSQNVFGTTSGDWQGALSDFNELRIGGTTYLVLGFKPSGKAASASDQIYLAEGSVTAGQPTRYVPGPGKRIHFTLLGKSFISDSHYNENGEFILLGEKQ